MIKKSSVYKKSNDENQKCKITTLDKDDLKFASSDTRIITEKDLSPDQKIVYDTIYKWINDKVSPLLTVGGYAGVGKSTVICALARKLGRNIAFCAYTGKAANVLRKKLASNGIDPSYCGTIHGLIYIPVIDSITKQVVGWRRRGDIPEDIIVVDEASMISESIWEDLRMYNKKILAVGDHGQLPPIKSYLNLMENPQLKLEKIHRQAEDNPIIKLSSMIRNGEPIYNFNSGDDRVVIKNYLNNDFMNQTVIDMFGEPTKRLDSAILCYYNKSRVRYNNLVRETIGLQGDPDNGDVVICLKNTKTSDEEIRIFNGMRGLLDSTKVLGNHRYNASINFYDDGFNLNGPISKYQFNNESTFASPLELQAYGYKTHDWKDVGMLFDYGYVLTCHKSQGSQFSKVFVFAEKCNKVTEDIYKRWLYTAVTRASEKLIMIL